MTAAHATSDETVIALCEEIARLRAENIGLRRTIDQRDGQIADLHAAVAAARAVTR